MRKTRHFTKGDWKYANQNDRFKYAKHLKDKKALRQITKLKSVEEPLLQNYTLDENKFESEILIPRALQKVKVPSADFLPTDEQEETLKGPTSRNTEKSDVNNDSTCHSNEANSIKAGKEVNDLRKTNEKSQCIENPGLLFRFKKELEQAEALKKEKESLKAKKDADIIARRKFLKNRRQSRCEDYKRHTGRTKKGQPKMGAIISALTEKIIKKRI